MSFRQDLVKYPTSPGNPSKGKPFQSTSNLAHGHIGLTGVLAVRQFDGRSFGGNGMQRMEGRSYTQPFVRSNFWSPIAERTMVNQSTRSVDNEQM